MDPPKRVERGLPLQNMEPQGDPTESLIWGSRQEEDPMKSLSPGGRGEDPAVSLMGDPSRRISHGGTQWGEGNPAERLSRRILGQEEDEGRSSGVSPSPPEGSSSVSQDQAGSCRSGASHWGRGGSRSLAPRGEAGG